MIYMSDSLGNLVPFANDNQGNDKLDKYSTTEQVVGTWIDGKPIYRKVFTYTETESTANNLVIASNLNLSLDNVVNLYGIVKRASSFININTYESTTYFHNIKYYTDNNSIRVSYSNFYGELYIILEYTKTTD